MKVISLTFIYLLKKCHLQYHITCSNKMGLGNKLVACTNSFPIKYL